jgi:hypothetical protein
LIISDLTAAAAALPASYGAADNGRATSGAANTLLGKFKCRRGRLLQNCAAQRVWQYSWLPIICGILTHTRDDNGKQMTLGQNNSESILKWCL